LENIEIEINRGRELKMEAFSKDLLGNSLLGVANPISYYVLVEGKQILSHDVDLFHNYKKTGNIKFTTQYIQVESDPLPNP
jgi:hypothetical protein